MLSKVHTKAPAYADSLISKLINAVQDLIESSEIPGNDRIVSVPLDVYLNLEEVHGELCSLSQFIDEAQAAAHQPPTTTTTTKYTYSITCLEIGDSPIRWFVTARRGDSNYCVTMDEYKTQEEAILGLSQHS